MPDTNYTFSASGQEAVKNAFRSISTAARQSSTAVERTVKAQSTAGRRVARAQREASRMMKRRYAEERRLAIRNANEIGRVQKKAIRDRVREEKKAARDVLRVQKRAARDQATASKAMARRRRSRRQMIGRAAGRLGGAALRGIGVVGAATAGVVGVAARQSINLQDRAIRLAVKGGGGGRGRADPTLLRQDAESVARNVRGTRAADVISAQEAFVSKTGNLDAARAFSETWAKIAVATATPLEDIGAAAADMFEKSDITTIEGMNRAFSVMAIQGKRGAFEIEHAAKELPRLAAAAKVFGLKGERGLAQLGGLTQIAKRGAGGLGGEETSTALQNMFTQIIKKSAFIKKKTGVDVFTDKTKTRAKDIQSLLPQIIAGAGGNLETLNQAFGIRGSRAIAELVSGFTGAREKTGGTEAEKTAAGLAEMNRILAEAINVKNAEKEINEDFAINQRQTGHTLTQAWENIVSVVGDSLTPQLTALASQLANMVSGEGFGTLLSGLNVLADSANAAAEYLIEIAGLGKGGKERTQKLKKRGLERETQEAQRALDPFRITPGGVLKGTKGMDPMQLTKRFGALHRLKQAQQAEFDFIQKGQPADVAGVRTIDQEQFMKAALSRGINEDLARKTAIDITRDPAALGSVTRDAKLIEQANQLSFGGTSGVGAALGMLGKNPLQYEDLAEKLQRRITEGQTLNQATPRGNAEEGGGQFIDTDKATAEVGKLASAAKAATDTLNAIGQATSFW